MEKLTILLLLTLNIIGCMQSEKDTIKLIDKKSFEMEMNGKAVSLFVLKNRNGLVSEITNYGGRVVSLWVPDKNGDYEDVVLGHDSMKSYLGSNDIYLGAAVGRCANRIGKGRFTLNGVEYTLATNNGENHLHGGKNGFNNMVWDAIQIDDQTLELKYFSKDGEEGYPGNMKIKMVYQLTDDNELQV